MTCSMLTFIVLLYSSANIPAIVDSTSKPYDIHKQLRYFETMKKTDFLVETRKRRSTSDRVAAVKEITFSAFGRRFQLVLEGYSSILTKGFQAEAVDANGVRTPFHVDRNDFFTGHLADDRSVDVDAYYEDGILCCTIHFPDDIYITEPAWRHLPYSRNHSIIAYRSSDVIWSSTRYPPPAKLFEPDGNQSSSDSPFGFGAPYNDHGLRNKRMFHHEHIFDPRKTTCPVLLKADYLFYRFYAGSKVTTAAHIMIGSFLTVNRIFRKTVWDEASGLTSFGVLIKKIMIFTDYTTNDPYSFNRKNDYWNFIGKLQDFSRDLSICNYCLAHLFTTFNFEGTVGFSYMATSDGKGKGGICSPPANKLVYDIDMCPRSGWTTTEDSDGHPIIQIKRHLVTAHEIGHSWGADHDPIIDNKYDECSPSERDGGRFLMYSFSVNGQDPNNKKFSPCSKHAVLEVLMSRSSTCFQEPETNYCGNGLVDTPSEQCDSGLQLYPIDDPCCNETCHLKNMSSCSDFNHACCKNCQIEVAGVKCLERLDIGCKSDAYCDGKRFTCPEPPSLPDGTTCLDEGKCKNGVCESYCQAQGRIRGETLVSCQCMQNATAACMRCCMRAENWVKHSEERCVPIDVNHRHQALRPCFMGHCNEHGVCVAATKSMLARLFIGFGFQAHRGKFGEFLKTNIVGAVICLSLIVWIPISLFVYYQDEQFKAKRDKQLAEIMRAQSVLSDEDQDNYINMEQQQQNGKWPSNKNSDRSSSSIDSESEASLSPNLLSPTFSTASASFNSNLISSPDEDAILQLKKEEVKNISTDEAMDNANIYIESSADYADFGKRDVGYPRMK